MAHSKQKSAATLTIHDAALMTPRGRKDVVKWLRRQAGFLSKYHAELSSRYTARYLYRNKDGS